MELLQIGNRTVAVGLIWQVQSDPKKALRSEAQSFAGEMARGAHQRVCLHVAYRPRHQEYALAERLDDDQVLPPKVLALAGVIADQAPGKWAARYALPDGRHWVICVIDGQVLADSDRLFDNVGEAEEIVDGWARNYIGLAVETHDDADASLADLTKRLAKARAPLLVPLAGATPGMRKYLAAAAVVLAIALLTVYLFSGEEVPEGWAGREPVAKPVPPVQRQSPPPVMVTVRPDPVVPPTSLGAACTERYAHQPVQVRSWWVSSWRCTAEGALKITWRRGESGSFVVPPPGATVVTDNPSTANETRSVELAAARDVAPAVLRDAAAALYEVARAYSLKIDLDWPKQQQLPEGVAVPGQAPQKPFFEATFKLTGTTTGLPEAGLFEALALVPGIALRSVEWGEAQRAWVYGGVLYARRNHKDGGTQ